MVLHSYRDPNPQDLIIAASEEGDRGQESAEADSAEEAEGGPQTKFTGTSSHYSKTSLAQRSFLFPRGFGEQTHEKKLGWKRRFFGIGPHGGTLQSSSLIHPGSPFGLGVAVFLMWMLLYTAVTTPLTVAFYWDWDPCDILPTASFDVFVDCFFIMHIVYTFFVGTYIQGRYVHDFPQVAKHYLTRMFLFDMITSFPVAIIELIVANRCESSHNGTISFNPTTLRWLRMLKPLRLTRVLKIVRTRKIVNMIGDSMALPPRAVRLTKLFCFIFLTIHITACGFWLVKVAANSEEERNLFLSELDSLSIDPSQTRFDLYVISVYFITTIFTTVGFGDISGLNTVERMFCICTMYVGSMIFGVLLAEVQEAVQQARRVPRERDNHVQQLLDFLYNNDVPLDLASQITSWATFSFEQHQFKREEAQVLSALPQELSTKLLRFLHKDALVQVPVLAMLPEEPEKEQFILDLYGSMTRRTFYRHARIVNVGDTCDRLYVINSGMAKVEMGRESKEFVINLYEGQFFGDYSLVGDTDWGMSSCIGVGSEAVTITALTPLVCSVLKKSTFDTKAKCLSKRMQQGVADVVSDHFASKQRVRNEQVKSMSPGSSDSDDGLPVPNAAGAHGVAKNKVVIRARWSRLCAVYLARIRQASRRETALAYRISHAGSVSPGTVSRAMRRVSVTSEVSAASGFEARELALLSGAQRSTRKLSLGPSPDGIDRQISSGGGGAARKGQHLHHGMSWRQHRQQQQQERSFREGSGRSECLRERCCSQKLGAELKHVREELKLVLEALGVHQTRRTTMAPEASVDTEEVGSGVGLLASQRPRHSASPYDEPSRRGEGVGVVDGDVGPRQDGPSRAGRVPAYDSIPPATSTTSQANPAASSPREETRRLSVPRMASELAGGEESSRLLAQEREALIELEPPTAVLGAASPPSSTGLLGPLGGGVGGRGDEGSETRVHGMRGEQAFSLTSDLTILPPTPSGASAAERIRTTQDIAALPSTGSPISPFSALREQEPTLLLDVQDETAASAPFHGQPPLYLATDSWPG